MSDDRLKLWFGFTLMLLLIVLAAIVAIGKIEEHTSHGLTFILGSLSSMAGGFSQWAFTRKSDKDKDEKSEVTKIER